MKYQCQYLLLYSGSPDFRGMAPDSTCHTYHGRYCVLSSFIWIICMQPLPLFAQIVRIIKTCSLQTCGVNRSSVGHPGDPWLVCWCLISCCPVLPVRELFFPRLWHLFTISRPLRLYQTNLKTSWCIDVSLDEAVFTSGDLSRVQSIKPRLYSTKPWKQLWIQSLLCLGMLT